MDGIRKITFVLSGKDDFHLLSMVEKLTCYDCEVVTLGNLEDLSTIKTSAKLKLYENVPEMPGYLRGLTDDLANSDLIVAVNPMSLSAFQALRAARKWKKPFGVISNISYSSIVSESSQEAKMMEEILTASEFVLTQHQSAKDYIELEGVSPDRVIKIPPYIPSSFQFSLQKREKFRNYIKVADREILLLALVRDDEISGREILMSYRRLQQVEPTKAQNLRILMALNSEIPSLKYLASDLGISKNILLMNQQLDHFIHDLSCASDIVIEASSSATRSFNPDYLSILASGPVGIQHSGSLLAEFSPKDAIQFHNFSFHEIVPALRKAVSVDFDSGQRERISKDRIVKLTGELDQLIKTIQRSLEGRQMTTKNERLQVFEKWQQVAACRESKKYDDAIMVLEEITECIDTEEELSDVYREIGRLQLMKGNIEKSMEFYDKSVQLNRNNWESYLGLAKVSLISHSEEDAIAFYKRVLALKPHQADALAGVGLVYRMLGMPEDSVYWLNRSLTVDPQNEKVLLELTQASLECEQIKEPIKVLEQLQIQFGDEPCLIMALGQLYMRDGKVEQGRAMVTRALEGDSGQKPIQMIS